MAQRKKPQHTATNSAPVTAAPSSPALFVLAASLMLASVIASFMMVLDHFAVMGLPGCGPGSGCAKAAASVWGKVPLLKIPTSAAGTAYFLAVLIAWLIAVGRPSVAFKWIVRLGVVASLFFLAIIFIEGHFCQYCIVAHAGNIGFWLVMEMSRTTHIRSGVSLAALAGTLLAGIVAFAAIDSQHRQKIAKRAEGELTESTQQIIDQTSGTQALLRAARALHEPAGGFTGRWRQGPENAPIRIVIFSDYQCTDCKAFEAQVRHMMELRDDVSVSAKHFPLDATCNQYATQTIHANACWAARAAEAAGILRGTEGFWQMHEWLFDRSGSFTQQEFPSELQKLGYDDPQQLINIMTSDQTLQVVRADVEEGYALGLYFTPMVFINGVELRGFYGNPNALQTAVNAVAATFPQPGSPTQDKPPLAIGKAVGDWRADSARQFPAKAVERSIGPEDAPIKILVWGDFQSNFTHELDAAIRKAMAARGDIRYAYRQYPMDQACNPNMRQTISNAGCWAARVAEAAGEIGGNEGYWKMHEWLMANSTQFNEAALRQAAPGMGFDPDALVAAVVSQPVQQILARDIAVGKPFVVQGVPTLYINGKWVSRWKLANTSILDAIFEEAGSKASPQ